ncbi:integral membrane protein [Diaporthe helianthi]|uniref:Integral membrane protein n=1 Tax=Diaporthe helianthi TaxID=158607 RepID=A0A2P5HFV5_DIAHE|nr:integral membrane protein [Diaporthe helianthi]
MDDVTSTDSITPLPAVYRRCHAAMLALGVLSLVTTSLLVLHITCRLIRWKLNDARPSQEIQPHRVTNSTTDAHIDLSLGLSEAQYFQTRQKQAAVEAAVTASTQEPVSVHVDPLSRRDTGQTALSHRPKPPNPLLLLIYNLLLSDICLSAAYMNNAVWLQRDMVEVGSAACHAQGWIVSFGCLATSGFLFTISIFSYLGIIRGRKPTTSVVVTACAVVWVLSILIPSLGLFFVDVDEFYRRQVLWCWVSEEHRLWRLTVYIWGFTAMLGTFFLYSIIFYRLWRENRSSRFMPRRPDSVTSSSRAWADDSTPLRPSGHHPAFLVYPCIYLFTATPLIIGSLIPALERVPVFMGISGALLAATGLLDSILWSFIIVFSDKTDIRNTGLDQFTFMRTPEGRNLGNIVYVQGGQDKWKRQSWHSKKDKGWWRLGDRNSSQPSLPLQQHQSDGGIQMNIVTMVVVDSRGERSSRQSRDGGYSTDISLIPPHIK